MEIKLQELISYTDWERGQWREWFSGMGRAVLELPTGGERHRTTADLIKHIFAAEMRYVQRMKGEPLTPYNQIPTETVEELFEFGYEARAMFKDYVNRVQDWDRTYEFNILDLQIKAPVRKFMMHILVHEIRHWAQVALLLRQAGYQDLGDHDFINSE